MSWRAYQILSVQPDFTSAPQFGLGEGGATFVEFGQATAFGAWHGDTSLAMGFDYRFQDPAQQRSLRQFFNEMRGRATPFFCPSWEPDFELVEAAMIGSLVIRVKAAGFVDITEDRPDTEGRQIFLVAVDGSFQAVGVVSALDIGGGVEQLTIDFPLAYTFQPTRTIIGRLRMVRFTEDRSEFKQERPGFGAVRFGMVTARQTRRVNDNPVVEGDAIHNLEAFEDVIATDEDPILTTYRSPMAIGPVSYATPQADNFFTTWSGNLVGTTFTMTKGGTPVVSTLYDAAFTSSHVTFGFDASGREALAWTFPDGTIRLGWKDVGVNTWIDFPGTSPVMFQTWAIDGTVSAGDADLIVFYLRPGFSGIFCRFLREDFATERLVCRSPVYPIYLQLARREAGRIEIVGMDAGHRLCRWRTDTYQTPLPFETASVQFGGNLTGEYTPLLVPADVEERAAVTFHGPTGIYQNTVVAKTAPVDGARVRMTTSLTGAYIDMSRDAFDTERSTVRLATTFVGTYVLVAKPGTAPIQNAKVTLSSVTGTYGP